MSTSSYNPTAYVITDVWTEILPADGGRDFMSIQNQGDNELFIGFDDIDDDTRSISLAPGAYFEPAVIPTNKIKLKSPAGLSNEVLVLSTVKNSVINN